MVLGWQRMAENQSRESERLALELGQLAY
jgi:hypothetical protein